MRKRYRVLLCATLMAALSIPLWVALSFESAASIARRFDLLVVPAAAAAVLTPVIGDAAAPSSIPQQRFDAARLVMIGTALFGLAAVVRKTI
jgi:hypothetical protein